MILSRIALRGSSKTLKRNPIFANKESISQGAIIFRGYCPLTYLKKTKCVYPVNLSQHVRLYSSIVSQNSEVKSEEKANNSDNEIQVDLIELAGGDPEVEKRMKILLLEQEILKQEGQRVPTHMKASEWKELLKLPTRTSRRKFYKFLFSVEKKRENTKRKKQERKALLESEDNDSENCNPSDHISYGFRGSTIFLRIYDATMNSFYNYNAIRAIMFGQKLVFDCSYDSHMTSRESKNCAKQLVLAFSDNRLHPDPFDLYLTGSRRDSSTLNYLREYIPTMYDDIFPLNVTENSYLELFPREKLVYLTPHCREELLEYDPDAVYIVGAMVDKVNNEPLSLAKAKREGLKMAKLPLDYYLDWGTGGKSLTLNQMLNILLVQKQTRDWKKSLVHVPKRKLVYESPVVRPFKKNFVHKTINVRDIMY